MTTDVAGPQLRNQHLLEVGPQPEPVDGPFHDQGSADLVAPQGGQPQRFSAAASNTLAVDKLALKRDRAGVAMFGQEDEAPFVGPASRRKVQNAADLAAALYPFQGEGVV